MFGFVISHFLLSAKSVTNLFDMQPIWKTMKKDPNV